MKIACGGESAEVRLDGEEAILADRRVRFRAYRRGGEIDAIEIDGRVIPLRAIREGQRILVWCEGRVFELRKAAGQTARAHEAADGLISPMPGRVRQILFAVGGRVARGQVVLILEAMKMEHAIRAHRDGVVAAIAYKEGDLVEAGVRLAEIRTNEDPVDGRR